MMCFGGRVTKCVLKVSIGGLYKINLRNIITLRCIDHFEILKEDRKSMSGR